MKLRTTQITKLLDSIETQKPAGIQKNSNLELNKKTQKNRIYDIRTWQQQLSRQIHSITQTTQQIEIPVNAIKPALTETKIKLQQIGELTAKLRRKTSTNSTQQKTKENNLKHSAPTTEHTAITHNLNHRNELKRSTKLKTRLNNDANTERKPIL